MLKIKLKKYECKKCHKIIDSLEVFPNSLCLNCYEKIINKIPLNKLDKPDFVKCVNF